MASILQKFDLSFVDPTYNLELKQALTVKPKDLFIRAKLRHQAPHFYPTASILKQVSQNSTALSVAAVFKTEARRPMYIFYGSNTGTSEAFSQRIANDAPSYGV